MIPFLIAAKNRGCEIQVGIDMLFEQIPAYLEFFGFPSTTPEHPVWSFWHLSVRLEMDALLHYPTALCPLCPKADVCGATRDVRFVPIADIRCQLMPSGVTERRRRSLRVSTRGTVRPMANHCIWSSMFENAALSLRAFLISSQLT